MDILEKIVAHKKKEVAERKKAVSGEALESAGHFKKTGLSLKSFLLDESKTGIIAEFKRASPSKGTINATATVAEVTAGYAKWGASGISVLTDAAFFGGSLDDLAAATVNDVPLLRKDFMVDEYQVIEAKAYGADVILLIAACLTKKEVRQLAQTAKDAGLEVLLEVHNEAELEHICDAVDLVGVNNRSLKTFSVDMATSLNLIDKIPAAKLPITESGITDVETIVTLKKSGFKGFLIGENFMKQPHPAIAFAEFVNRLKAEK